uniref:Small ribosomal subunit protein uS2c n=1 Tax=Hariotina sp. MMOGRB0030F TaxID=1867922 RepID=A0A2H4FM80_9CHLO|nr:ribosomal protein S2 [Hariotina sp. MMOGRB0030F]
METVQKNFSNIKKNRSTKNFSNIKKKNNMLNINENNKIKEILEPGDVLNVKIHALGSKNIGVAELKNGYTVLVPNTKCGEKVQVKIEKIFVGKNLDSTTNQKIQYAVATVNKNPDLDSQFQERKSTPYPIQNFDIKVGQKFKVKILKKGPKNSGLVPISKNFLLIVPNTKVGETLVVEIQKIKPNYAFAKSIVEKIIPSIHNEMVGQQLHIVIPSSAKTFSNYFVFKFHGNLLFVKKGLGVQSGELVKIQIQKAINNFVVAKILQIRPISMQEKKIMAKQNLQKMIQSSMHFGEKAIRCNANMRKYIWYKKTRRGLSFPIFSNSNLGISRDTKMENLSFSNRFAYETPESNLQNTQNQKRVRQSMTKPFLKRGRHVLNLLKTQCCFNQALKQLAKYAAKGKTFLFVGTKKPASSLIAKTALLSNTSFFVNTRWLGGMLTNWKTILKSISQIRPILKQKQKILQKILEKRQKILSRLFNKVYVLRKKSQKFMMKGKYLIRQILVSKNFLIERSRKFMQQKNAILFANLTLLNASKNLKRKKIQIFKQMQQFEMAATEIFKQKQQIKSLVSSNIAKFKEFEQFLTIGKEFVQIQKTLEQNGQKFVAISYDKFATLKKTQSDTEGTPSVQNIMEFGANIPTPSPEIFQKMISILSNFRKENWKQTVSFESSKNNGTQTKLEKNFNRAKSHETGMETQHRNGHQNAQNTQENTILLSKFFNKFLIFLPFFQNSMEKLRFRLIQQQKMLAEFDSHFQKIVHSQQILKEISQKIMDQLSVVFSKFIVQRTNFQKFQKNFQQFAAEQRLLKFLPKLRYLPASAEKMYETVELFMKKFVDPKLIYPMEQIYDQKLKFTSKKMAATRKQKWQRLEKYFGGITKMAKMNTKQISKNVAIIIGQQEEMNAVHECKKLGMKIFAVVDTNCNPKYVDHIIPANDDSRNSIKYILGEMLTYIRLGQKLRKKVAFRSKLQQNITRKKRFDARFAS